MREHPAASSYLSRFDELLADAFAAVRLVDHKGRDPASGAPVMRHWHEEQRRRTEERCAIVGDEHAGSGIG
jgi:hypothetical protein